MQYDAGSDYYQLCYDDDNLSLSGDDDTRKVRRDDFPYEQYTSSPGPLRNKLKFDVVDDYDTEQTDFPVTYTTLKFMKDKETNFESNESVDNYKPSSELKMWKTESSKKFHPLYENIVTDNSSLDGDYTTDVLNFLEVDDNIRSGKLLQQHHRESQQNLQNLYRGNTSSSGISLDSVSPIGSSTGSLSTEIERLRNITSPDSFISPVIPILKRTKSYDGSQFLTKSSYSRSSTPTGRKSPLLDFFLGKSKVYEFDNDFNVAKKKKQPKFKKSFDSLRSSSPFFFRLRRSNSLSSKDKYKNRKNSKSLTEMKNDLLNGVADDSNQSTKLQQPSPFVKTIFQYVESSFDDELFGMGGFSTNNTDTTPVFSCNGIKVLPEFKTNSLPRKSKNRNYSNSLYVKTISQDLHDPLLLSSGRRVSENSDFLISVVAYLDRIRKAQQKPRISLKRRPRQRRHRSDPVGIAKFLKDIEIPDENKDEKYHHVLQKKPDHQRTSICNDAEFPVSLNGRFSKLDDDNFQNSSVVGVVSSHSDPTINSISQTPVSKPVRKDSQFSRRTKSLKNIFVKKKSKEESDAKQRNSISSDLQQLCNLDNDLSSEDTYRNLRDSRADLQNFIDEFEQHNGNECQKFPISRTECDYIKHNEDANILEKNKFTFDNDNVPDLPHDLSDQLLAIELLRKLERLEQTQSCINANTNKERHFVCFKDNLYQNCYDKHYIKDVDFVDPNDDISQLSSDFDPSLNKDILSRENNSVMKANLFGHENSLQLVHSAEKQLKLLPVMAEVVDDKANKISKPSKSKKKYGRSNSNDFEYWMGSFNNSPPQSKQGNTKNNTKIKSVFNIRRQFDSFKKKDKKDRSPKNEENSDMFFENNKKVRRERSSVKFPKDTNNEEQGNDKQHEEEKDRIAKVSIIRSVFEKKIQHTPTLSKKRTQSLVNESFAQAQHTDDKNIQKTSMDDHSVKPFDLSLDAIKQKFEQLAEKASPSNKIKASSYRLQHPKSLQERVIQVDIDKSIYDDCSPIVKKEQVLQNNTECNSDSEVTDGIQEVGHQKVFCNTRGAETTAVTSGEIDKDEECVFKDEHLVTSQPPGKVDEDNESIIVDVPAHLLPPELVTSAEISTLQAYRKRPFRSVEPLSTQKSLSASEEELYNTSSDFSVDTNHQCSIVPKVFQNSSSTEYDSDDDQYCDVNDENEVIKEDKIHDSSPPATTEIFNQTSTDKKDNVKEHSDCLDSSDEKVHIDFTFIPNIPPAQLLQQYDNHGEIDSNDSKTKQYASYSSMASNVFKDVAKLYGHSKIPMQNENTLQTTVSPTIEQKPNINEIKVESKQHTSPNIAMVSPFIKNETAEMSDDSTAFAINAEAFDTIKRKKSVSEIGKNFELLHTKTNTLNRFSKSCQIIAGDMNNEGKLKTLTQNESWKTLEANEDENNNKKQNNVCKKENSETLHATSKTDQNKIQSRKEIQKNPVDETCGRDVHCESDLKMCKNVNCEKGTHLDGECQKKDICSEKSIVVQIDEAKIFSSKDKTVEEGEGKNIKHKTGCNPFNKIYGNNKSDHTIPHQIPSEDDRNINPTLMNCENENYNLHFPETEKRGYRDYQANQNNVGLIDENNNATSEDGQNVELKCYPDKQMNVIESATTERSLAHENSNFDQSQSDKYITGRRSTSPKVDRQHENSSAAMKIRSNSTGHSPDITLLLQHLICDIEEEVAVSSEDEGKCKKINERSFKQQQLDSFNSHLDEITSHSADSINTMSQPNRNVNRIHGRLRRTFSEDDVGLKLLREQRQRRKRLNASEEKMLTRKPSVIWARVKRMEVSLALDQDYEEPEIIKIESFDVRRVNTHKDVEELAVDTFLKHIQLLDKQTLDLTKDDINYLLLGDHKVPIGAPFDLSFAKIQDGFLPCQVCVKGKKEWSLAAMAYDTLIPKSYLEKYVSLLLSRHYVIFYGPSGTGKSYLVRRIAMFMSFRLNEGIIPPIVLKNVSIEKWKSLLDNLHTQPRDTPFVIVLDGFSTTFINSGIDIADLITTCQDLQVQPYIICTLTQHPNIETPLQWQQNFRWIWLPNHEKPVDGLLQRYLRRKFIQCGNQHLQRESFRIADWLASTWRHINSSIEKFSSAEATIGATMFYTCPSDILIAEEWFVDLWNYSITPYFIQTVKQGIKLNGYQNEWVDPLELILKTYPWVSEKAKRKMKLRRIRKEDVGYRATPPLNMSEYSPSEQQRLLGFLQQLEVLMTDGGLGDLPNFDNKIGSPYESFI